MNDCLCIIGVDKYSSRLDLARSLGATHVINTSDSTIDLGQEVKRITDGSGSTITIDTTGNMGLIEKAMNFTANRGQMIILGVPPLNSQLHVHLFSFMQVRLQTSILRPEAKFRTDWEDLAWKHGRRCCTI